jgi:hypothetical protein
MKIRLFLLVFLLLVTFALAEPQPQLNLMPMPTNPASWLRSAADQQVLLGCDFRPPG